DRKALGARGGANALRIHVLGAKNLVAKDFITKKSDPFVVIRGGGKTFKTSVISKTLNPRWNQIFEVSNWSHLNVYATCSRSLLR
uniref:C2 domain-containing protein n=1 Tax=Xenopus tropicalis TaxID=8364 RepID=A0A6I8Q4F7_XENTR